MTDPAARTDDAPLFHERFRWVLLQGLRSLRDEPSVDLDEPEQLEAAYGFASHFVLRTVRERGLASKLDPEAVATIVESDAARSTVREILISWASVTTSRPPWQEFLKKPEIQAMLSRGAETLASTKLEESVQRKRMQIAKDFGLHAHVADVRVSDAGEARIEIAFDQDIAFEPDDLKELVVNGVPLSGAQLVEVRRDQVAQPALVTVISVNVERWAIPALKQRPLQVAVMTKEDVRVKAIKMA